MVIATVLSWCGHDGMAKLHARTNIEVGVTTNQHEIISHAPSSEHGHPSQWSHPMHGV
jgi:hypothetical protein